MIIQKPLNRMVILTNSVCENMYSMNIYYRTNAMQNEMAKQMSKNYVKNKRKINIKMERNNNMELNSMNMVQLRALAKENNPRGYSRLRKNDLINLITTSIPQKNRDTSKEELRKEPNKELTRRQRKRIAQKASKESKKSKNLRIDINNFKSQKDDLEEKIKKVSSTMNARFKGKKLRSMKREAYRLNELIKERTKELEKIEFNPNIQTIFKTSQQSKETKRIKKKIEDINRKIRRVKGGNKSKIRLEID